MARTRLFGKLRRIAALALESATPKRAPVDAERPLLTRRQLTTAGAQLAAAAAFSGCSSDPDKRPGNKRVAVVGAGIAGLHCAYRLQESGVDVTVFEAASRVGGRMFTAREKDYAGQIFELGGELIDTNHATMLALAKELELTLDDRFSEGIQNDVWFVNGREVPEATVVEQFSAVAPTLADAVAAADDESDDAAFIALDETPLAEWLDDNVPRASFPELHALLTSGYRGEFGLETRDQSALNLLYLIDSSEPDPFRIYGESDERYHCAEGSDAFPTRLAAQLAEGTVKLELRLTRLSRSGEAYRLTLLGTKSGERTEQDFDHVVLAVPFSVLRSVELDVPLSDLKRQIIDELGYGTNAKVMGQFRTRVWREEHRKSGSVTSDLPLQQLWDTSIGQTGDRGILTNFLGGQAGVDVGELDPEEYYTGVLADVDLVFPGAAEQYRSGSARLMHWPSYEHTRGSYTCYRPGQWAFWTQEGVREGNVHFCGEHTSVDFQGWMEGAAETGALVAAEIIDELGFDPSAELLKLVAVKAVVPQPALPRVTGQYAGPRLGYRQRREALRAASLRSNGGRHAIQRPAR